MKINMKKLLPYFILIALTGTLTGCNLAEDKPYEYYTLHPEELSRDYNYCEKHPSADVCLNIVKKYLLDYRQMLILFTY